MRLLVFFGLSFALSACATFQPSATQRGLEEKVVLLEKKVQEISAQVEKNRGDLLRQETRINNHQVLLDQLLAEKVTPESPKAVFDPSQPTGGGDFSPAAVYREAFGNYASGRYPQAILGFRNFLGRFADNSYTPNAHFWLGESHYALGEYPQALKEFGTLVNIQPPSDKVPEGLARMVAILKNLREDAKARDTAEFLLKTYPESVAAKMLQRDFPEFRTP